MIQLPGFGGRDKKAKKIDDRHFVQEAALVERSRQQVPSRADMYSSLGSSVYMVEDPEVDNAILENRELSPMYPAFSFLNRLTKHGQLQSELLALDYEALILITKMNSNEDEFEADGWRMLAALEIYAQSIISDSHKGFKAEIVTTQVKSIKTELVEGKKRRLLPL